MDVKQIHQQFIQQKLTLALAESCTGGSLSSQITAQSGSSSYFLGSVVVYSNELKERLLGVTKNTLLEKGPVSSETVVELTSGLFVMTSCDIALSVSGYLGPSGGDEHCSLGTVYIGVAKRGEKVKVHQLHVSRTRQENLSEVISVCWKLLYDILTS
jgi:PncC family amidohydrolase